MDSLASDTTTLAHGRDLINNKRSSNDTIKRGSKLKPPSKISSTTKTRPVTSTKQTNVAGFKYTISPRPSTNDRLSQHRMSHSSINRQRPKSPTTPIQRHLRTPRQTMIATGRTVPSSKSPVAQLRQNYDTLKLKYDVNEQRIAEQQAELELLRKHLEQTSPPSTPPPSLLIKPTNPKSKMVLEEALLEKDKAIQRMEQCLEEMQRKLDDTNHITPVEPAADNEKMNDQNQTSTLEVKAQMEKLKLQNETALSQLITKEKELETLRTQTLNKETSSVAVQYTQTPSDELLQLQRQLDEQKRQYEAILHQHELTILEKERLLNEQAQCLTTLKDTQSDELRRLQTDHSKKILRLGQQHKQEIINLQQKMHQEKQQPDDQITQEYFESELERIVHAFEQTEHDHKPQPFIPDLLPSSSKSLDKDRLKTIGASQGYTSTRYLPTQAVSWPDPQPLSILRKTSGPFPRRTILTPILAPSDPSKVQIYLSSVSGNPKIKKNQDHIQQLLKSQQITFELVDVATSETVLQYMKRSNGSTRELPQLFVGGEFRGLYADVVKHMDEGTLNLLLTPRQAMDALSSSSSSSSASSALSLPSLTKTLTDEDEALLKDLEREFGQGNIDLAQLDHL